MGELNDEKIDNNYMYLHIARLKIFEYKKDI